MKELSIEEKAKAYDKAYKRVAVRFGSNVANEIFPELQESEDEKVRKEIISFVEQAIDAGYGIISKDRKEKWIAWLEKQGEQNLIMAKSPQLGEQKPVDNGESNLLTVERAKEISPFMRSGFENENPAWSEEDEQYIIDTINLLSFGCSSHSVGEVKDFLKSIKDRVQPQPKQEWSEEDEDKFNQICSCVEAAPSDVCYYSRETLENWLKSLRPQNIWRPSERQKEALLWCVVHLGGADKQTLGELLETLNKL